MMTSKKVRLPGNVTTCISSPISTEVRAALDSGLVCCPSTSGPYCVFSELDVLNTPKLLTFITSIVSHLAAFSTPHDVVYISTSEFLVLCRCLLFINRSSQRSAFHIIMKHSANVDEYLA